MACGLHRGGSMRLATIVVGVLTTVLLLARPAAGLTRGELVCQAAIGKAAHRFLAAELAAGERCRIEAMIGRSCNPGEQAEAREAALERAIRTRCYGVTFANLVTGGCTTGATNVDDVVGCIVAWHRLLVEQALAAEFGVPVE